MARPPRQRQVDAHIREGLFVPCTGGREAPDDAVELTLDGLEALRLVDVEGLYQEAAAEAMGVSRATLARVLARARRAVAEALVRQHALVIGGGAVRRGQEKARPCPIHGGRRRRGRGCRCGGGRGRGRGRGRGWGVMEREEHGCAQRDADDASGPGAAQQE